MMWVITMTSAPRIYATAIKGTSFSVTEATRFNPPRMTSADRITSNTPVTTAGMPKADCMLPEMEFTWLMLPMPKDASTQKHANRTASTRPSVLQPFFAPKPSER